MGTAVAVRRLARADHATRRTKARARLSGRIHGIRGRERRRGRPRKELTGAGRRQTGAETEGSGAATRSPCRWGLASMAGRESSKAMVGQISASMSLPTRRRILFVLQPLVMLLLGGSSPCSNRWSCSCSFAGPGLARGRHTARGRWDGSTSSSPPRTVRSLHAVLVATHPFLDHQAQVREIHLKEKSKEEWTRHLSVPCGLSMHYWPAVFSRVDGVLA